MEEKKDYYLNNPDHPLAGKFDLNIKNWTSPIGEISFKLPEEIRMGLIDYIVKKSYHQEFNTISTEREGDNIDSKYVSKHFYNLLTEADSNPHIKAYKEIANELIRFYSANAWSVPDMENTNITGKCFGNLQVNGQRTYPHYHHGFDGVMITYLTIGDEFDLDITSENLIVPSSPAPAVEPSKYDHTLITNAKWAKKGNTSHPGEFEGQNNMILLDPRPTPNYPYNTKAKAYVPAVGKTIIHPAYFWHESNTFVGNGIRVAIILNFCIGIGKSSDPLVPLAD